MDTTSPTRPDQTLLDAYTSAGAEIATIYLPSPSRATDAAAQLAVRAKNVRHRLEELGASTQLITVVTDILDQRLHDEAEAFVLAASADGPLVVEPLVRPVERTTVTLASCPSLLPLLEAWQIDQDHLAVLADRTGAEVYFRSGVGPVLAETTVEGQQHHVHRGKPGGWSQRRFQQIAENTWEDNARTVVAEIVDAFPERNQVIVGGDERAVGFIVEHLPSRMTPAITVDGSRHAGPAAFLDEVDRELRNLAAERTVVTLDDFRSAAGGGLAATGRDALDALSQGRAQQLLVTNDADANERTMASFDFDNHLVVADGSSGKGAVSRAPITDGAVALAVARGTSVMVVPTVADLTGGIGVTLRG